MKIRVGGCASNSGQCPSILTTLISRRRVMPTWPHWVYHVSNIMTGEKNEIRVFRVLTQADSYFSVGTEVQRVFETIKPLGSLREEGRSVYYY